MRLVLDPSALVAYLRGDVVIEELILEVAATGGQILLPVHAVDEACDQVLEDGGALEALLAMPMVTLLHPPAEEAAMDYLHRLVLLGVSTGRAHALAATAVGDDLLVTWEPDALRKYLPADQLLDLGDDGSERWDLPT